MIVWQILNGMLKLEVPAETLFWMYDIILVAVGLIALIIYLFAWDILIVWLAAWWQKKPIVLQWTKSKQWKFKIPTIDKGSPDALILDDRKGVIELRREAVGLAPHKVPLVIATSEFPAVLSPTELEGERYYTPQDSFYGAMFNEEVIRVTEPTADDYKKQKEILDNLDNQKFLEHHPTYPEDILPTLQEVTHSIDAWKNRQLYVRYPSHTINVSEFVNYQKIAVNPELIASYAEDQVIEAKNDYHNPLNSINIQVMVPLIMILAIAYYIISQQNIAAGGYSAAMQSTADYHELLKTCGSEIINKTVENPPNYGGKIN